MSKFSLLVLGMVACCGAAAHAQVVKGGGGGLPLWTNIVDESAPLLGGYTQRGTCPCAGQTAEGEADCGIPVDLVNGGCNSTPNVFGAIALGGSVCGTSQIGTANLRDTDWFRFTVPTAMNVEWVVRAEFPVQLLIINDICPATVVVAATGLACVETAARATNLAAGNYIAFVSPQQGSAFFACMTGSNEYVGTLRTFVPPPPPANNDCSNAACFTGTSVAATTVAATPDCVGCCFVAPDVWYKYKPTTSGTAVFNTCTGSGYDTVLSAHTACGTVQTICNDDNCALLSRISVSVTANTDVWIRVSGFGNLSGAFTLTLESGPAAVPCAPVCVADVDDGSGTGTPDGGVTIDDLLYYLDIFDDGDVAADVDDGSMTGTPDGGVTIDDLLYYLFRFDLGC